LELDFWNSMEWWEMLFAVLGTIGAAFAANKMRKR